MAKCVQAHARDAFPFAETPECLADAVGAHRCRTGRVEGEDVTVGVEFDHGIVGALFDCLAVCFEHLD